jgi:GGDEF domain-containing protein/CBS domain-containing protein
MKALPAIQQNTSLDAVFDMFRRAPQESFFPVIDAADEPHGIIHERDLKEYIYMPFGRELLSNRSYQRALSSFVTACPIVDVNTDAERILEIFANARGSDGVIVTENLKYVGVLSASALLTVMNEKQLQQAQDQNPLTELPGNLSITDYVAVTALDGDHCRHFCYFDFDNFKPFNDRYGFAHGDRAISLFAMLMRRHAGASGAFLGHIGGDDFFVGFSGREESALEPVLMTMLEEFRVDAMKMYSAEDQRAGCTTGADRDGQVRRFNLMRCSVAVIAFPAGLVTSDLDRIHAFIADAKREAKRSNRGYVYRQMAA